MKIFTIIEKRVRIELGSEVRMDRRCQVPRTRLGALGPASSAGQREKVGDSAAAALVVEVLLAEGETREQPLKRRLALFGATGEPVGVEN